jgi:hypothetical protein
MFITGRRPAEREAAEKEIAGDHRYLRQLGQARGPRPTSLVQSNAVNETHPFQNPVYGLIPKL